MKFDNKFNRLQGKLKSVRKRQWRNYIILAIAACIVLSGFFVIWAANLKIPTLESFSDRQVVESTKIYDRTGKILLYDVNQNTKRTVVPFDSISRNVKNATIAIEDKNFYQHSGVEISAFFRALLADIVSLKFSQGGSTITQQVVKNSLLSNEKKISRKIKEWVLAIKLERVLSKDEILNLYLNEIPYGGAIYGVEEASETFFGVHASELTLAQSAYLAALPQAPSYYSPYGNHKDQLEDRKNLVLSEMLSNGFISQDEYDKAKTEKVTFLPRQDQGIKAPHFVFYVIDELEKKYGEDTVLNGGLRVKTTLDYSLEQEGESIANQYALENKKKFNAENAAFVAIDPTNGQILSMVGSRNYFDTEIDGNFNISTAHRQPGSTFKPFVYATAFNKGYTPETVLFDVKTQFSTRCPVDNTQVEGDCYAPEDYDGKYRGPMTLRNALAQSINIPSVKLLYLTGIPDAINQAERMGIKSLGDANQYGLTLVLGGGEVSLLDMVSAYGGFATEGVRHPYNSILEVTDSQGKVLEEYQDQSENVLPKESAQMISSILSDNNARAPSYGQTSALFFPTQDVAVKTGTTNNYKDAWIIGYTPNVVLGAWAGNNDNSPMEKKVAGLIVSPMWRAFMDKILASRPVEKFNPPPTEKPFSLKPVLRGVWQGGISYLVDSISGKKATDLTPVETTKELLSGGIHSILYWINKDDPRGPAPQNPEDDPQFKYWEFGVQRYLTAQGIQNPPEPTIPSGNDDIHTQENQPSITIISPQPNSQVDYNQPVTINVSINSHFPTSEVDYFINGNQVGSSKNPPFNLTFTPKDISSISNENLLKSIVIDSVYDKAEANTNFTVNGSF